MTAASPNRLVDYFVITGLDANSGLEPDKLSGDNLHCPPLDRPYKCKVLAHYPEAIPWNPFDQAAVGMLCLPRGLTFRTQKQSREPRFHSFIITKEDGSRVCGSTYVFYEEVSNQQICAAMQTLQAMYQAEGGSKRSPLRFPPGPSPDSPQLELNTQFEQQHQQQQQQQQTTQSPSHRIPPSPIKSLSLVSRPPQSPVKSTSNGTSSVGTMTGSTQTTSRSRSSSSHRRRRRELRELADKCYDSRKDRLFVTKAIALVTQLPYVNVCKHFLSQLYDAIRNDNSPALPLDVHVHNILYDIPLLPPGRSMKIFGVTGPIFCQRPSVIELPLFDFPMWELFKLLGVDNVLRVFTCVLLEHQVLFYSADYQRLMLVAESITSLMFPFQWQHVYVPILPASLIHFIDAPVPFIMGLHHGTERRSQLKLPSEANMCFVDIDTNAVELPEDLPSFPHTKELREELILLIAKYQPVLDKDSNYYTQTLGRYKRLKSRDPDTGKVQSNSRSVPQNKQEILQKSEAYLRISAIAERTGVFKSLEDITDGGKKAIKEKERKEPTTMPSKDLDNLKFCNTAREIFLNRFVHLFRSYESFVIQPSQDMEAWLNNRETMQNFDKAAFLSDQPEAYLPFLSPFTETQMFASLIDNKILGQWEDPDRFLRVFDMRLKQLKDRYEEGRIPGYSYCTSYRETEAMIEKRTMYTDHVALKARLPITPVLEETNHQPGFFPLLNTQLLNTEPAGAKSRARENAMWRKRDRLLQHSEHLKMNTDQREFVLAEKHAKLWQKYIQEARSKVLRQPSLADMNAASMAQTNWKFVETLLKECKSKTKRMLVEKMGQEAVELGHGEVSITGVEENTLIASLCDLLERIWGHGLQAKKGKSALWSHMLSYQEVEECHDTSKPIDPNFLTPDLSSLALEAESKPPVVEKKTHRRKGSKGGLELPTLLPLPRTITVDMRNVQAISDLKTDVGFARAFVRLALEKKLLSTHLKELLVDSELLRSLYKRYAFLRCEDEREQFLYHLLSLNAVDYFCFTNTFTNTMVSYRVLIFPSLRMGSHTSANPWVSLAGQLGEAGVIEIPKHCLEFTIQHKNLGVLTTLRLGHDNGGLTPKWLVEYVLVRNELTGHIFKFPCGRWLGKGIDDGSIERLLVGELLHHRQLPQGEDIVSSCQTPPRARSPSATRRRGEEPIGGYMVPEIQEMLGHAVNNLVKHFYKPEKERGNLTYLLCGDRGLVSCMEHIFQHGFRSSRLFRHKFFIWDYLERVKQHFEVTLDENIDSLSDAARAGYCLYCNFLEKVNDSSQTIGKDGKFQIFICVGTRDHYLQRWLPLISSTIITAQMYEESSFLRTPSLINFLVQILDALNEFPITLEKSLVQGLDF